MKTEPEYTRKTYLYCGKQAADVNRVVKALIQFLLLSPLSGRLKVLNRQETIGGYSVEVAIWTTDHDVIERWNEKVTTHVEL